MLRRFSSELLFSAHDFDQCVPNLCTAEVSVAIAPPRVITIPLRRPSGTCATPSSSSSLPPPPPPPVAAAPHHHCCRVFDVHRLAMDPRWAACESVRVEPTRGEGLSSEALAGRVRAAITALRMQPRGSKANSRTSNASNGKAATTTQAASAAATAAMPALKSALGTNSSSSSGSSSSTSSAIPSTNNNAASDRVRDDIKFRDLSVADRGALIAAASCLWLEPVPAPRSRSRSSSSSSSDTIISHAADLARALRTEIAACERDQRHLTRAMAVRRALSLLALDRFRCAKREERKALKKTDVVAAAVPPPPSTVPVPCCPPRTPPLVPASPPPDSPPESMCVSSLAESPPDSPPALPLPCGAAAPVVAVSAATATGAASSNTIDLSPLLPLSAATMMERTTLSSSSLTQSPPRVPSPPIPIPAAMRASLVNHERWMQQQFERDEARAKSLLAVLTRKLARLHSLLTLIRHWPTTLPSAVCEHCAHCGRLLMLRCEASPVPVVVATSTVPVLVDASPTDVAADRPYTPAPSPPIAPRLRRVRRALYEAERVRPMPVVDVTS